LESHETGYIVWKNLNQTFCQSLPTADRRHWNNKLIPLTRHRLFEIDTISIFLEGDIIKLSQ